MLAADAGFPSSAFSRDSTPSAFARSVALRPPSQGTQSAVTVKSNESDEWTGAQVVARRDVPIGEVLDEWARCSVIVEPMIAEFIKREIAKWTREVREAGIQPE